MLTPIREDSFLTIEMAMEQFDLPCGVVELAIQEQRIRTARLGDTLILSQADVADLAGQIKVDRSEFSQYEAEGISLTDACRRYGFNPSTISRWIEQGYIRKLPNKPKGPIRYLLCRADLEYARRLADVKGLKPGKSLFGGQSIG
jgi:hypothetical protein